MDSLFAVFKLYLKVGKPLVYAALNGYKGTLLTYGQTGTGIFKKTTWQKFVRSRFKLGIRI